MKIMSTSFWAQPKRMVLSYAEFISLLEYQQHRESNLAHLTSTVFYREMK